MCIFWSFLHLEFIHLLRKIQNYIHYTVLTSSNEDSSAKSEVVLDVLVFGILVTGDDRAQSCKIFFFLPFFFHVFCYIFTFQKKIFPQEKCIFRINFWITSPYTKCIYKDRLSTPEPLFGPIVIEFILVCSEADFIFKLINCCCLLLNNLASTPHCFHILVMSVGNISMWQSGDMATSASHLL